ncbi:MAG: DNA-directed DNA polymerase II small subunit [Halobacteriota archaeon]|jgi:DNA polymerase II small subunit
MIRTDIIQKLTESGFLITQEAVVTIQETDMPLDLVNEILKHIDESVVVIDQSHVATAKESLNSQKKVVRSLAFLTQTDDESADVLATAEVGGTDVANGHLEPRQKPRPIVVLADITESSTCVGTFEEFVRYFRNRYDRLSEIIRKRLNSRPIESLTYWNRGREGWFDDERGTGGKISIIGLVNETRDTPNGHRMLELEDPTGYFSGIALKNKGAYDAALQVVLDEVVGITGSLSSDGKVLFIDSITWPDIPPQHQPTHAEKDVHVALTSDIHIGSKTFLTSAWKDFAEWVASSEDERAQKIAYVIVAGDVVDGIGVFPNQEDELAIDDIDDQYAAAASLFEMLPSNISIIVAPGNHDAVRQAEPQPALSSDYAKSFNNNVTCIGNPALIELCGVKILIYHGRALDDIIAAIPGCSYGNPDGAMREMLKRRHLSPVYGNRVSIAPESTDHFIIDSIPDILHCGHVHTIGASHYRGVTVVNSGAWQGQTKYQRSQNINPRPGIMPVCNLGSMETTFVNFLEHDEHQVQLNKMATAVDFDVAHL